MTKILAVDDSVSMRLLVTSTLEEAGYDVISAVDGADALDKAKTQSTDLVIADVNMPRMDGLTLVSELRSLDSYRFTPILMLTTETDPSKKATAKAAGATGWIVKPFEPAGLIATVKRVLG